MADAAKLEELTGIIQELKCERPTFCAGIIHADGRPVSFSVRGFVKSGDCVTLVGVWTDTKWGRQFKAREANITMPVTPAGLVQWLAWKVLRVGPVTAQRLVDEYGVALMDRCASDPESVAIFSRLPLAVVEGMAALWASEKQRVGAFTYFASLGLTKKQCDTLLETIKSGSVQLVDEDPYRLIGLVTGFGWGVVDALAAKLSVTGTDPRRLRGALTAITRESEDEGSTAVNVATACRLAADKLGVRDPAMIAAVVQGAVERGDVRRFGGGTDETDFLATPHAHKQEEFIWRMLAHMKTEANPYGYADEAKVCEIAEEYRTLDGLTFDDYQLEAIKNAIRHRVSVTTGSAGSGKTSLARAIVKFFQDGDVPVRLAAPTGKAAKRMREVIGHDAETIHRLLEFNGGTKHFARDRLNPLQNCAIICDEASMISSDLLYRILAAMGAGTVLVLIGDPNQLPPVDAGAPLRDILAHELAPATRLERVHRQAGYLKTNCTAILAGKVEPNVTDESPSPWVVEARATSAEIASKLVADLYAKYLPKWKYDPIRDAQFMTAKHDGAFGTKKLNLLLQRLHQASLGNVLPTPDPDEHERRPTLYAGDKVVQDRNDYDLEVFNGDIGVVVEVAPTRDGGDKPIADLIVQFGAREVTYPIGTGGSVSLAYCLTGHRMQGSQVPCAITLVPKSHGFIMNRNWLYTCATRAQKTCVILGDPEGIRRAAEKQVADARVTVLRVLAMHEAARPA